MPRNKIEDLRNHLFLTLEKLHDGDIDLETAKAIKDVGQVIVNSAKVEVDFVKVTEGRGSGFIPIDSTARDSLGLNSPKKEEE